MKRHVMLLAVFSVLGIFSAGCGPATEGQEPQTGDTTEQLPTEESSPDEGHVEQFARNCKTTCSGTTSTGSACGVVGFGSTTFLGGCTKACRFARQDANSKAASYGCQLANCSDACN